jgi:hypothetical protein
VIGAVTPESIERLIQHGVGAAQEREAIVKWLREQHRGCTDPGCRKGYLLRDLAAAISKGAHKGSGS